MNTAFSDAAFFSDREKSLSQLILQLALHAEVDANLLNGLSLDDGHVSRLKAAIACYERELSNANPTLSSLLASKLKSKCCT